MFVVATLYIEVSDERILMSGNIAGPLLDAVQMSSLYPDSKTFVDKKLKQSPGKIIKRFEDLVKSNDGKSLTKEQIKEVIAQNHQCFLSATSSFLSLVPLSVRRGQLRR